LLEDHLLNMAAVEPVQINLHQVSTRSRLDMEQVEMAQSWRQVQVLRVLRVHKAS
jgi:hypothetical protein